MNEYHRTILAWFRLTFWAFACLAILGMLQAAGIIEISIPLFYLF